MTGWTPVTLGCSAAEVLRSPDGRHHAKRVRGEVGVAELRGERDRQQWLEQVGVAAPLVVEWSETSEGATLVSTTVPGIPASSAAAADAHRAMRGVGMLLARLHRITTPCPFDRRLAVTVPLARRAAEANTVDVGDLDEQRIGRTPESLLSELERRTAKRTEDVVLCHGDASLPNLFLDPVTWEPTGFVDVGRLGRADRYLDLALVLRSMSDDRNPGYRDQDRPAFWSGYGTPDLVVDTDAVDLYQLLDEFF